MTQRHLQGHLPAQGVPADGHRRAGKAGRVQDGDDEVGIVLDGVCAAVRVGAGEAKRGQVHRKNPLVGGGE